MARHQRHHGAAAGDAYPTRGAAPAILPRLDPCVYPGADRGTGLLGPGQLASYDERGYLVLDNLLGAAELAGLRHECERLRDGCAELEQETLVHEPAAHSLRSIFAVHRQSAVIARLVSASRLRDLACQVLGSEVYVHQSRLNLKPAFDGREFFWHSDFETWHAEDGMPRMRALSLSIALDDNTACNGPLMLIGGSHRHFVACAGATPADHYRSSLRRQEYGVPDRDSLAWLARQGETRAVLGPAGTVTVFDCNTQHASSGNLSAEPRSNLFLVFNSVLNGLVAPYCGRPPRPEFIASRVGPTHVGPRRR